MRTYQDGLQFKVGQLLYDLLDGCYVRALDDEESGEVRVQRLDSSERPYTSSVKDLRELRKGEVAK